MIVNGATNEQIKNILNGNLPVAGAGDASSLGGETAEEWDAKFDKYLPLDATTEVVRNINILATKEDVDTGFSGDIRLNVDFSGNYTNKFRMFELGGSYRGVYLDISKCAANIGSELLHTGNKPAGSYTGNGSTTERTIATGGSSQACLIYNNSDASSVVLVTPYGAFGKQGTTCKALDFAECSFINGTLKIKTASNLLNTNGVLYVYQVL